MLDWPLDPALLEVPQNDFNLWAIELEGQQLGEYISAVGRNTGDAFFKYEGRSTGPTLSPWLPSADYRDDLLAAFPRP